MLTLAVIRRDRGIRQKELADECGVQPIDISVAERGLSKLPERALVVLEEKFGLPRTVLFGEYDEYVKSQPNVDEGPST